MKLTTKEKEIITTIRNVKNECANENIIFNIIYEPLTEGWLQTIRVANPQPITAIHSEMKTMLSKIKKELGNNQVLFNIFYDAGVLAFFRAISVSDHLDDNL